MTYIRCPACGATALNVATTCPKCHAVLAQNPMQLGSASKLVACRTCGKHTPRHASSCVYCGAAVGGRRVGLLAGSIVVGGVVVAAAVWFVALRGTPAPAPDAAPVPAPAAAQPAPRPSVPAPADVPPAAAAEPARGTEPAPTAPPIVARRPAPTSTFIRYTGTWLNLRQGPSRDAAIVRPLPPGARLEVANPVGGWWTVYENGVAVGFVSGTELRTSPPPSGTP